MLTYTIILSPIPSNSTSLPYLEPMHYNHVTKLDDSYTILLEEFLKVTSLQIRNCRQNA